MKIAVAIITRGRPEILCETLRQLERQERPPDQLILSATCRDDIEGAEEIGLWRETDTICGAPGVSLQRNRALEAGRDADLMVFFDDDFAPAPDSLKGLETLFSNHPEIVAATGQVVADGARGAPITPERAARIASAPRPKIRDRTVIGLYGCNMALRMASVRDLRFDEGLPLYGWQEDLDFGARIAKRGAVVRTGAFGGVHMGVKSGRHPQRGLGYAQIANPFRLLKRKTVPAWFLMRMMASNVAANLAGAVTGDPWADRRGRLRGNVLAFKDLMRGQLDPERARSL